MTKRIAIFAAVALIAGFLALAAVTMSCGCGDSTPSSQAGSLPTTALSTAAQPPAAPPPATKIKERKVVILDPGHGGDEVGAAANGVVEKASNLDMAMRVEKLLRAQGLDVVLTRHTDARAAEQVPGYTATRTDLQARLDVANTSQGDVFVSLHSNGSDDTSLRGVEAWYDSDRAFAAEGKQLAGMLKDSVLHELSAWGYNTPDRGLYDGKCFRNRGGRCFTLFVIAGPRETTRREVEGRGGNPEALGFNGAEIMYSRPANMPATLLESLFISNASDAATLRNEGAREAIARGISNAIVEFLKQQG